MSNVNSSAPPLSSILQQPISPYLTLLSQTTSIQSMQSIIHKCLSDPQVYVGFNELSALPNVQKLVSESTAISSSNIGRMLLATLDLFSFGSYLDYKHCNNSSFSAAAAAADRNNNLDGEKFMVLNDGQEMKLKMLTVVSIVKQVLESGNNYENGLEMNKGEGKVDSSSNSSSSSINQLSSSTRRKNRLAARTTTNNNNNINNTRSTTTCQNNNVGIVHYTALKNALDISSNRQLEDILIQCIYSNLLPNGTKLNQKQNCIIVQHSLTQDASSSSSSAATQSYPYVLCRDVNLSSDLSVMISKLDSIYKKSENVKLSLNKALVDLNVGMREDAEKWNNVESMIQLTKDKIAGDQGDGNDNNVGGKQSFVMDAVDAGKRQSKRSRGARPKMNFGLGSRR